MKMTPDIFIRYACGPAGIMWFFPGRSGFPNSRACLFHVRIRTGDIIAIDPPLTMGQGRGYAIS
jgi:hypothetical protein